MNRTRHRWTLTFLVLALAWLPAHAGSSAESGRRTPFSILAPVSPEKRPPPARSLDVFRPHLEAGEISPQVLEPLFGIPMKQAAPLADTSGFCQVLETIDGPQVPDTLDVLHYDIEILEVDEPIEYFRARTTIHLVPAIPPGKTSQTLTEVDLHLGHLVTALEVEIQTGSNPDFQPVSFSHENSLVHVGPFPPLTAQGGSTPAPHRIRVTYEGTESDCWGWGGIAGGVRFNQNPAHRPHVGPHTFGEPNYARYWYPCHDVIRDKATSTIAVTVPEGRVASATGMLEKTEIVNGKTVMTWRQDEPVPPYLIAFYLGDFVKLEAASPGGVPLEYFTYPSFVENTWIDWAHAPDMMDFFSERFVPYPYERYAMTLGEFGGGMEHITNSLMGWILIRGDRSHENIVSHEMAHQWWGDLLTPVSWRHIWLNEGFARYAEWMYIEHKYGWDAARTESAFWDSLIVAWDPARDHPILDPPRERVFTFPVYNKGARVLDMLRGVSRLRLVSGPPAPPETFAPTEAAGDERFFQIFSRYAERFAHQYVSTDDFQRVAEEMLGEDLNWFFDPWLTDVSFPRIEYDWTTTRSSSRAYVHVRMRVDPGGPFVPMPIQVRYQSGETVLDEVRVLAPQQEWVVELPSREWEVVLDPENWFLETHEREDLVLPISQVKVYPNPSRSGFNITATITGSFREPVTLTVVDVQGRRVRRIDLGRQDPGSVGIRWDGIADDGRPVRPGSYYARIALGSRVMSRRLVVLP